LAQSIKLADDIMMAIRKESKLQSRSGAKQIEHWVNIGRVIERSKAFDYTRIRDALEAKLSPDELHPFEQEVWSDEFAAKMTEPNKQEKTSHRQHRKLGRGVGMARSGELVYEKKST